MTGEILTDNDGYQWRIREGEEQHRLWLPITAAERAALVKKAQAESVHLPLLVANMLRQWMATRELSVDELDDVVAGASLSSTSTSGFDLKKLTAESTFDASKLQEWWDPPPK